MVNHEPYVQMLIKEFDHEIETYIHMQDKRHEKGSALSKLVAERLDKGSPPLKWSGADNWLAEMEKSDNNLFNLGYWLIRTIDDRITKSATKAG